MEEKKLLTAEEAYKIAKTEIERECSDLLNNLCNNIKVSAENGLLRNSFKISQGRPKESYELAKSILEGMGYVVLGAIFTNRDFYWDIDWRKFDKNNEN